MEGYERKEGMDNDREEIYSKAVRAGKRTYFFDVKATRNNDYYLTITESKKRFDNDGNQNFEKHKIFLYKEDFEKFMNGLQQAIGFIQEQQGCFMRRNDNEEQPDNVQPAEEQKEKDNTIAGNQTVYYTFCKRKGISRGKKIMAGAIGEVYIFE